MSTATLMVGFISLASAYIIDPPTTAAADTIQDCSAWYVVAGGESCASIAADQWITVDQFNAYNPSLGSGCKLVTGNSYCIEQNFGFPVTTLPPTTKPTSTPPLKTTPAPTPTNGIATPKPIQTGMVSSCDEFYLVVKDDTCYNIAEKYSITLDQFYAWNPAVGTTCGKLWPENYVCVSIIGFPVSSSKTTLITTQKPQTSSYVIPPLCRFDLSKGQYICDPSPTTTTKPTTTTTGNGIVTPTPIQSGMVSNCKKFYKVVSGDGCWAISNSNNIQLDDFYKWNPAVNAGGECKGLQAAVWVCIGV
ncbi:hypothetical protein AA0111_g12605 [Alternaria arborescens]|uniref:hypothetical protein n=1 Tax=Alternaria arborescens TaxID=156630 RepID=UPI001074DFDB|nr:hypothetical protein AA0111_g12605 [Alternaria arborescens]RYO12263.1 hypothetical protein AA0111_g12605 [Alternaria arborescens]